MLHKIYKTLLLSLVLLPMSAGAVTCTPGQYLPANATQCSACPGTSKYCPGGSFTQKDTDQGIFNCPTNTVTDTSGAACMIKLSKDMMKYGQNGKKKSASEQCWTQSGTRSYAQCVTQHIKNRTDKPGGNTTIQLKEQMHSQQMQAQVQLEK